MKGKKKPLPSSQRKGNEDVHHASPGVGKEQNELTLDLVEPGSSVLIVKISDNNSRLGRRLLALGLVPGTEVKVLRLAPLGCPVEVEVRGFHLALRLREASQILVELVSQKDDSGTYGD